MYNVLIRVSNCSVALLTHIIVLSLPYNCQPAQVNTV